MVRVGLKHAWAKDTSITPSVHPEVYGYLTLFWRPTLVTPLPVQVFFSNNHSPPPLMRVDLDGIWYCLSLWGLWVMIGHVQLSLLIMGSHWGFDNYRPFNYFSDFAGSWLKGVDIFSGWHLWNYFSPTHSKAMIKNLNAPSIYVCHWMRHIRYIWKILAASDKESDCQWMHCAWVLSLHLYRSPEREQYIGVCWKT